ncbi:MAG TPA: hypothetical protein VIH57_23180 [Bacteroidales bacterium]
MESFKIETPYNKDDFIRLSMVRFKIHRIKSNKQLRGFAIATIIIFGSGLLVRTDNEPYNPFMFIGFMLMLWTVCLLVFMNFSKRQFSVRINQIAEEYDKVKWIAPMNLLMIPLNIGIKKSILILNGECLRHIRFTRTF